MLQSIANKASSSAATIKQNIAQSPSVKSQDPEVMSSFLTSPNPLLGITMAASNLSSSTATSSLSTSSGHAGSAGQWEELRRQARVLENEVDAKLVSFSKLCANYTSGATARKYHSTGPRPGASSEGGDSVLVSRVNSDQQFENSARELEQQLSRLSRIIDQMSAHLQNLPAASNISNGTQSGAALLHTVQRHRDILADYRHEFQKTKANIMSLRERSELMGPTGLIFFIYFSLSLSYRKGRIIIHMSSSYRQ